MMETPTWKPLCYAPRSASAMLMPLQFSRLPPADENAPAQCECHPATAQSLPASQISSCVRARTVQVNAIPPPRRWFCTLPPRWFAPVPLRPLRDANASARPHARRAKARPPNDANECERAAAADFAPPLSRRDDLNDRPCDVNVSAPALTHTM
ncbi:hypothetical protein B0H13DRAFT_2143787 [Mycena leptocephala]|nr:hypothetical protein B0H13DRAFT_2143787 [Mycena leptocephala]